MDEKKYISMSANVELDVHGELSRKQNEIEKAIKQLKKLQELTIASKMNLDKFTDVHVDEKHSSL